MLKHSFVVHSGDSMNGDVFFMEVSEQLKLTPLLGPVHTKLGELKTQLYFYG